MTTTSASTITPGLSTHTSLCSAVSHGASPIKMVHQNGSRDCFSARCSRVSAGGAHLQISAREASVAPRCIGAALIFKSSRSHSLAKAPQGEEKRADASRVAAVPLKRDRPGPPQGFPTALARARRVTSRALPGEGACTRARDHGPRPGERVTEVRGRVRGLFPPEFAQRPEKSGRIFFTFSAFSPLHGLCGEIPPGLRAQVRSEAVARGCPGF